ncbi:MAG: MGH1-like glycoside hydrolase domain-containing protein, partial [Thermodesulfobacteriota bacterium]
MTKEEKRLQEDREKKAHWRRWGPYLSERQWGTVREDYSPYGNAWEYFSHDQSRSRAYRWGEDGIAGISDNHQRLCFALALWNGSDPILKERIFGLTGNEGNHGEDVKEYYFYLDSTPTHSYMKYLYKYPQGAYPYSKMVEENRKRGKRDFEYELMDTGLFNENRYFDVFIEYAKASPDDILIQIKVVNHGNENAAIHLAPTLWFRNTWSWGKDKVKPLLISEDINKSVGTVKAYHDEIGKRWFYSENPLELLFTENETNTKRLFGEQNGSHFAKDGINNYVVNGMKDAVNPENSGTKVSAYYRLDIAPSESKTIRLRLSDDKLSEPFGEVFNSIFNARRTEADEFYNRITPFPLSLDMRNVQRQAFSGMLWSKQFYYYVVDEWLKGDSGFPPPPAHRNNGRNSTWKHLYNDDILSMPDKWEYPWFAAWDLAFHTIPLAIIDPEFAKRQLTLLTREWYMHPNG